MIAKMSADTNCTVFYLLEKGEMKMAPSPLMPRKERTGGAARRANSLRLKRGLWKICYRVSVIPFYNEMLHLPLYFRACYSLILYIHLFVSVFVFSYVDQNFR